LTGGPGCGKSFTVKSVITLAAAKRAKIVLAAPTGRAAKRLAELSGHPAATVHRLLQLRPGGDPSRLSLTPTSVFESATGATPSRSDDPWFYPRSTAPVRRAASATAASRAAVASAAVSVRSGARSRSV